MSKMSELHHDLEIIRAIMEGPDEEPQTPKEIAEHKTAMAVRDCWLAMGELCKLRNDPISAPFVADHETDLWSIQTQVALLLADIETSREPSKLRIVSHG